MLTFFNSEEGYVQPVIQSTNTGGSTISIGFDGTNLPTEIITGFEYTYQYKDHLGNIRLSYQDIDGDGQIEPSTEIKEENHYYPFGLKHKGYNNQITGRDHQYGYNGKEEQNEFGLAWVDITVRNYDPSLGRWMNIDPLAEKMRNNSPYNFAFNNPVFFQDYDGMQPDPPTNNKINSITRVRENENSSIPIFIVDETLTKDPVTTETTSEDAEGNTVTTTTITNTSINSVSIIEANGNIRSSKSTTTTTVTLKQATLYHGSDEIATSESSHTTTTEGNESGALAITSSEVGHFPIRDDKGSKENEYESILDPGEGNPLWNSIIHMDKEGKYDSKANKNNLKSTDFFLLRGENAYYRNINKMKKI